MTPHFHPPFGLGSEGGPGSGIGYGAWDQSLNGPGDTQTQDYEV